jgi:hypothetical protein
VSAKAGKGNAVKESKVSVDIVERPSGKYRVETGPFTIKQAKELEKTGALKNFEAVDARLAPPQSLFDRLIKGKTFKLVADGYGGMIVPDVFVEALWEERGATPVDKSFKQTPDMLMYEACAGTVIKVTKKNYTARLSSDENITITVDGTEAKVGDRVLNVQYEDGGATIAAQGHKDFFDEYNDGDSVVFYITKPDKDGVSKLEHVPTIQKHVPYPRERTINGVSYPYVYGPADEGKIPYAIIRTEKGWTVGGDLVQAQHAENVAVNKADSGGSAPTKFTGKTKTVLFIVKNLAAVVQAAKGNSNGPVTIDAQFITVNQANFRKQSRRSNVFGGAVFSKNHDPKLAHGWYKRPANEEERQIFNWLFSSLYSEALKKLKLAPSLSHQNKKAA